MVELKKLYKVKDAKEAHDFLIANDVKIWSWAYYKARIKECRQRYIAKLINKKEEFLKSRKGLTKSRKRRVDSGDNYVNEISETKLLNNVIKNIKKDFPGMTVKVDESFFKILKFPSGISYRLGITEYDENHFLFIQSAEVDGSFRDRGKETDVMVYLYQTEKPNHYFIDELDIDEFIRQAKIELRDSLSSIKENYFFK